MSSDRHVLTAIAAALNERVRWFDLVLVVWGSDQKKCVLAVGQNKLTFMRQDFVTKLSNMQELDYSAIVKVIKDKGSEDSFLIILDTSQAWKSDRLFMTSQNRDATLQHIQCCWQTHMMSKMSKPTAFPLFAAQLTNQRFYPIVYPFSGYAWQRYRGYKFMLPETWESTPNVIQTRDTGQFRDTDIATGVSLKVQVRDLMSLEQMKLARLEHIRWVAIEYKAKLVQDVNQFYVIRNGQRSKRMNIVSDVTACTAWETIIRTRTETIICHLVRRQYIPPMCDVAQDISLVFRCSSEYWQKNEIPMILQAQVIADSLSPTSVPDIHRGLVHNKLSALRFDEEGTEWILNYQRISSGWRGQAVTWVRELVQIFQKAGLLTNNLIGESRYLTNQGLKEDWLDEKESGKTFKEFVEELRQHGDGFVAGVESAESLDFVERKKRERVANRWLQRISRYFAWATDGGFLGVHFNIEWMIENIPLLEEVDAKKARFALLFMLHLRETNWELKWEEEHISYRLADSQGSYQFNDRIMQWIINGEYLRKEMRKGNLRGGEAKYFKVLAQILKTTAGTTLKAYICRIFMEMRMAAGAGSKLDDDANTVVVPALLHLIQHGGVYLATFASAALVNLSHENEIVKLQLMSQGLAQAAAQNLRSKDDDLICYTTTLMVNLTKEAHHRYIMANAKILPLMYDLLTSSYAQVRTAPGISANIAGASVFSVVKEKILANLCSLFGHFCKDEEYRDHIVDCFSNSVKCVCYIATTAVGGTPLMSKVLYALKQFCASSNEKKMLVGATVIKSLLEDQLKNKEVIAKCKPEFLMHAILLLQMLSSYKDNCLKMNDVEGITILEKLLEPPAAEKMNDQLKETIRAIMAKIRDVVNRELAIAE